MRNTEKRNFGDSISQLGNVRDEAAALLSVLRQQTTLCGFVASHLTKRTKKPLGPKLVLKKLHLLPESELSVPGIMRLLEDCNCLIHHSRKIRDVGKEKSQ
ncbi:hypothetical protein CCR75_004612 [Bremia lactucae]|uniref:Uncharacterized protein n=1 Tax=Bremia lactucae TaxID=4779 RepID=A0A976ILW7_BRELC|nr:hypothetical protein CCR75_004612 [Bremia lactucae]